MVKAFWTYIWVAFVFLGTVQFFLIEFCQSILDNTRSSDKKKNNGAFAFESMSEVYLSMFFFSLTTSQYFFIKFCTGTLDITPIVHKENAEAVE